MRGERAAEQIIRIDDKPLGLVWLYCPYPVLARGLVDILREDAWVYHGEEPLEGENPSLVLFCAGGVEDVRQRVEPLQASLPGVPILVFGMKSELPLAQAALRAGARGFVHAGMEPSQIVRALSVAAEGEYAVPRELLKNLVADEPPAGLGALTPRQQEILKLVAQGWTNAQIGQELYLSESTVKQHLRSAYKALNVRNRTEAARLLRGSI